MECGKSTKRIFLNTSGTFIIDFLMLVLYETAMGYCLFKVSDSAKLESADLWKEFESPEKASKLCVFTLQKGKD